MAKRKKRSKKKSTTRKTSRRTTSTTGGGGSESSLSELPVATLQAEIQRRERRLRTLQRRREKLLADLDDLDREIADIGGSLNGRRGGGGGIRPRNTMNLVDALHQVLSGQTMSVTEAAEAVQQAGYQTSSDNFRTIVNQALISNPDRFKRVARGQYTAK